MVPKVIVAALVLLLEAGSVHAGCGGNYKTGSDCCNIFGGNCDGPCWNAGCKTSCQKGQHPGFPVTCHGNDRHYMCCPPDSGCVANVPATQACCNQEFNEITTITDFEYDFDRASDGPDALATQTRIIYHAINNGGTSQAVGSITQTVSSTQTSSWTFESTTEISASATFETGIPFVAEGKVTVGVKQSFKYGKSGSKTQSIGVTINTGSNTIAPFSRQQYQFNAKMTVFTVPFTATATKRNQCGNHQTAQITGSARISGVASFATGQFTKIVGPAVPIECQSPFNAPPQCNTPSAPEQAWRMWPKDGNPSCKTKGCSCEDMQSLWRVCTTATDPNHAYVVKNCPVACDKAQGKCRPIGTQTEFCPKSGGKQCADNPVCVRLGLTTGVCCDPNNNPRACCAVVAAHPTCLAQNNKPTDVMCPTKTGVFAACCTGGSKVMSLFLETNPAFKPICNQEFNEITAIDAFEYDFDHATNGPDPLASQVRIIHNGVNGGAAPQAVGSIFQTVLSTQTSTWNFDNNAEISFGTTFQTGIPFVADGKISVGAKHSFKKGTSGSSTQSTGVTINTGNNMIPPFSRQQFQFDANMTVYTVPFTATATKRNQCGKTTTAKISGSARISGVASFAPGHFTKIVGPAVPVQCQSPFHTPMEMQGQTEFCSMSDNPFLAIPEAEPMVTGNATTAKETDKAPALVPAIVGSVVALIAVM